MPGSRKRNSYRTTGRGRFNQSVPALRRQLHVETQGAALRNGPDPKTFTSSPWNAAKLSMLSISDSPDDFTARVSVGNIRDYLISQLSLPTSTGDAQPQFRLKSVRAWLFGLDGGNSNNGYLRLNCSDLVLANSNTTEVSLKTLEDLPGKNHWASVGYVWPRDHMNTVFHQSTITVPLFALSWRNSASVRIYLDILWRFPPPGANPTTLVLRPERVAKTLKWINSAPTPEDQDEC